MEFEVKAHGQELTEEFLDELFVSIIVKIPDKKWVEIKKNRDQVIAGIKHLIDMDFYGQDIEVVFNNEFTHFKKRLPEPERKPHPFEGKYLTNHPASYWTEQDRLALERRKRDYERAQKRDEIEGQKKRNGRSRKTRSI